MMAGGIMTPSPEVSKLELPAGMGRLSLHMGPLPQSPPFSIIGAVCFLLPIGVIVVGGIVWYVWRDKEDKK